MAIAVHIMGETTHEERNPKVISQKAAQLCMCDCYTQATARGGETFILNADNLGLHLTIIFW